MSKKTELKRELSKATGIDLFNPKYREIINKYFPNEEDAEEKKLKEIEDVEEDKKVDENEEDVLDDVKQVDESTPKEDKDVEDKLEDVDKAEDEREIDKIEEDKAENDETKEDKAEEVNEESHEIGKDVDELKDYKSELLDAKIELELIKNGVRPERLESAKKYAKYEIGSLEELYKVKDMLREYPEWVRGYRPENFGMPVDENKNDLTEEEKRLKAMGINPRD